MTPMGKTEKVEGRKRPDPKGPARFTPLPEVPLESPMGDKIAWAQRVYEEFGKELLSDPAVSDLLKKFERAALDARSEMLRTGIVEMCGDCDLHEGGSCCGRGIENRYSGVLLLLNLLLGRTLSTERQDPSGCLFLGKRGCLLLAREVICVNYLCGRITEAVDPALLAPLREREGKELDLLFLLTERVRGCLKKRTSNIEHPTSNIE